MLKSKTPQNMQGNSAQKKKLKAYATEDVPSLGFSDKKPINTENTQGSDRSKRVKYDGLDVSPIPRAFDL